MTLNDLGLSLPLPEHKFTFTDGGRYFKEREGLIRIGLLLLSHSASRFSSAYVKATIHQEKGAQLLPSVGFFTSSHINAPLWSECGPLLDRKTLTPLLFPRTQDDVFWELVIQSTPLSGHTQLAIKRLMS